MEDMKVFNSSEFGDIRVVDIDGEPWFVGKDIADVLGYKNASKAIHDHVDDEDKLNNESLSSLGQRGGWLINESGLYALILKSKLESAKRFKHWVTSEVLPSIRKHGAYMTPQTLYEALTTPDALIQLLQTLKDEQVKNAELKTVNTALVGETRSWDNRKILNALIRAYGANKYGGAMIHKGWKDFYHELLYKEGINVTARQSFVKATKKPLIEFINQSELPKAIRVAVAMCEKIGIDTAKVINEQNMERLTGRVS